MDALNVPSAAVVGSSSGGYVAQQLAIAHPRKVAALVLLQCPEQVAEDTTAFLSLPG
nr:alpha/beta hydrolase [Arthrobacter sp. Soil762]